LKNYKTHPKDFNCNFFLEVIYKNNYKKYYDSGILIRTHILATSASNLYNKENGYPDQINCFSARFKDKYSVCTTVYSKINAKSIFVSNNYKNTGKDDVGLIVFDDKNAKLFGDNRINISYPYFKLENYRLTNCIVI